MTQRVTNISFETSKLPLLSMGVSDQSEVNQIQAFKDLMDSAMHSNVDKMDLTLTPMKKRRRSGTPRKKMHTRTSSLIDDDESSD